MNKGISLKKFLLFLVLFLFVVSICLLCYLRKAKPLCKINTNECNSAVCEKCTMEGNQKVCSECSLFDKEDNRIWTGGCIFNN